MNCACCEMYWMCKNCPAETSREGDREWGYDEKEED